MNHTFHCHLRKSLSWYHNWHSHPRHQHTHWLLFLVISILTASALSGQIGNFYHENEYAPSIARAQAALTLSQTGDKWSVNGQQRFLLFASYFHGLAASDTVLNSDLSSLRARGFGGVRILIDWPCAVCAGDTQYRLFNSDGSYQGNNINRLRNFLQIADSQGMVVDLTFHDVDTFTGFQAYQTALSNATADLTAYRGVIFDLQNEANGHGLSASQVRTLRDAVKARDGSRLVTASVAFGMSPGQTSSWFGPAGLDFVAYHDDRSGDWPGNTDNVVNAVRGSVGSNIPIYLQEPERYRGTAPYADSADDWFTAARNAKCAGAAGWTFHTNAAYDLTGASIFSQFNGVENQVVNGIAAEVGNIVWDSCRGTGGPPPPPPPPPSGNPPFGPRGICPAGYIELTGANASGADPANNGFFCDNDGLAATQVTYPVQGFLMCNRVDSSGVAFVSQDTSRCQTWDFSGGQPTQTLIARLNCDGSQMPITITNGNIAGGAWTTSPSTEGVVCIQGTEIINPPPPPPPPPGGGGVLLTSIDPGSGAEGDGVMITGLNLDQCEPLVDTRCNVMFFDANGTRSTVSGTSISSTTVMAVVASGLCAGPVTVAVGSLANPSNALNFTLTSGTGTNCTGIPPTQGPVINNIQPRIVAHGDELVIYGDYLTENVQFFDPNNGSVINVRGWVSIDHRVTRVLVPIEVLPGFYNIGITGSNGSVRSPELIQVFINEEGVTPTADDGILPQATNFTTLIGNVFTYAVAFVGIAVFIMILYGGFLWMTSAANPGNISRARSYISNAIIGAILLLSAYVILYTINPDLIGGTFTLEDIRVRP